MSFVDFCLLTEEELAAVFRSWTSHADDLERGSWERMRVHACISVQPHVKRRLTPAQLLPLAWDREDKAAAPKLTAEERRARREEVRKRLEGR